MSNIKSKDLVLVIGGGSLPVTPALVTIKTKANIVVIDIDQKAIKKSSKFINDLNLKEKIKLEHADGLNYPVEKFSVIFVVYGMKREKKVLNYLSNNMNQRARIIFRTTLDALNSKKKDRIDLSSIFNVKDHISSESLGRVDSFLLCKK